MKENMSTTLRRMARKLVHLISVAVLATLLLALMAPGSNAATVIVTNTDDSGAGSLRQVLADAADGDTITFSVTGTITLASQLTIGKSVSIVGPGSSGLAVSGNSAVRVFLIASGTTVTIDGLTIKNGNVGFASGGGIFSHDATVTIVNCTVSANSAYNGGGIFNSGNAGASAVMRVVNSTISGNTGAYGAGIYNYGYDGSSIVTVTNSTLSGNSSGGIFNDFATLSIGSTILNAGSAGWNIYNNQGTVTSLGNNLSSDPGSGILTAASDMITTAPLLGPLQNNGGRTFTHALLPGSPAIDAGLPNGNVIDQRGVPRVVGAAADIGAFESGTTVLTVNTTADTSDGSCDPLGAGTNCTLREAILAANADPLSHESIFFEIPTTDPGYDAASARHTISFTSDRPTIDTHLSIVGPGRERLTVRQTAAFAVFYIYTNGTPAVSFSGLTLTNAAGGVSSYGAANVSVRECLITGNSGSAVSAFKGSVNVSDSILSNNGGGISSEMSNITVDTSDISNNSSYGGIGVYLASLTVRHTTIANNTQQAWSNGGGEGGGIYVNSSSVTIDHSTISGNTALTARVDDNLYPGEGGGIFLRGSDTVAVITNTTIAGNSARRGGGIEISRTLSLTLQNTIVAGNSGGSRADISGPIAAGSFNLIGNGTGSTGLVNGTDGNQVGGISIAPIDSKLGPLADNGGPTRTRLPLCGSPAIDRGKNLNSLATDQRGSGFARTFDDSGIADADGSDATDIGAVELQAALECNTAPLAVGDSYSVGEDTTLNVPSPGILGNDTDGENDTLTAILIAGPANGTLTLNPTGSFSYTPSKDFNGSDSFTYKANDGSLDSIVATVTITATPVNDAPVVSVTPSSQSVQYSDSISSVVVTAADVDTFSLSLSTQFSVGGGAFEPGLPAGLAIGSPICTPDGSGVSCIASLNGTANVPADVFTLRFTASDGQISASADHTLTVTKEHIETEFTGDVHALTAGPRVTTANVRLAAQLTQEADGKLGDITTKAKVSFLLFKGGNLGSTPDLTVSGVPVDASGAAITFANLPVDTWTVKVKIDAENGYWKANPVGMGTITIEQPTAELRTSGGGWVTDSQSLNEKGNFSFNVANQKKGVRGSSIYLFRGLDGFNYLVKSTSWNSGGIGFRREGSLTTLASFSGKCLVQKIDPATGEVVESFGNYSFTVDVRDGDLFKPRQPDKYAITILSNGGVVWRQVGSRTSPPIVGGGNVTVKGNN